MARANVKCFLDDCVCLVCQDYFKDPVILKCGHNFCRACITLYWEEFKEKVPCPDCSKEFPEIKLRPNVQLRNVVELTKELCLPPTEGPEGNRVCEKHQQGDSPAPAVEQSDGGYQDDYHNLSGSETRPDDIVFPQIMDPSTLAERSKNYKRAIQKQLEMVTTALMFLTQCLAGAESNPGIYERIREFRERASQQLSEALVLTQVMRQKANSEHLAMMREKKYLQDKLQRRKMHLRIFKNQCNSYSGLKRESNDHLKKSIDKLMFLEKFLSEMEEQRMIRRSQSNRSLPSRLWLQLRKHFTVSGAAVYEKALSDVKEAVAGANQDINHWKDNFLNCSKEVKKYSKMANEEEGRIEDNEKGIKCIEAKIQKSTMLLIDLRKMQCGLRQCSQYMDLLVKIAPTAAEIIKNINVYEILIKDTVQNIFLLLDPGADESRGCEILFSAKITVPTKKRKHIKEDPVFSKQLKSQPNKKQK